MGHPKRTRREAWEERVDRRGPDECWPWLGRIDPDGYGRFRAEGRPNVFLAHRVAFEVANGREPIGVVRHSCDTPWCQNDAHLLEGTQTDNVADMNTRGRGWTPKGETHGNAKLTDAKVREMREAHEDGATIADLARQFDVSRSTAADCVRRRSWRHVA